MSQYFKNTFILIWLFAVSFQPINNAVILVNFKIDQALIEKTLCEQRENQIDCHGTCHLTKQLNQTNTSNQGKQLQLLEIKSLEFYPNTQEIVLNNEVLALEAQNMNFKKPSCTMMDPETKNPTPPPRLLMFT